MISLWHLLWLLPLAGAIGFWAAAMLSAAKRADEMQEQCFKEWVKRHE